MRTPHTFHKTNYGIKKSEISYIFIDFILNPISLVKITTISISKGKVGIHPNYTGMLLMMTSFY